MSGWTTERVTERFEEAVNTLNKLPVVHYGGYRSSWPAMVRSRIELSRSADGPTRLTALPDEITRMEETFRWIYWVSESERRLIWCRAYGVPWRAIEHEIGIPKTTAQRQWMGALREIARRLETERIAA